MIDYYTLPALVLLGVFGAVFAALYWRFRTPRCLLWLIGWLLVEVRLAFELTGISTPWRAALADSSLELSAVMFLGSMSVVAVGAVKRYNYLAVFCIPLLLFSVASDLYPEPRGLPHFFVLLFVVASTVAGIRWGLGDGVLPPAVLLLIAVPVGIASIAYAWVGDYRMVLYISWTAIHAVTAILIAVHYRRWSAGVILSIAGLVLWTVPILSVASFVVDPLMATQISRTSNLMKCVAALGMILLLLEEQLDQNDEINTRERRVRREMEKYARLDVSFLPGANLKEEFEHVCDVIVESSRFREAALFLRTAEENFTLVGACGLPPDMVTALDALGRRITPERLQEQGEKRPAFSGSIRVRSFDLRPFLLPDDQLRQFNFLDAYVIPLRNQAGQREGSLVLNGLRDPERPLVGDDLIPLELLTARIVGAREKNLLLRRAVRSERLAGLGQLAGGVAHELNNPLTVVMGYADLMAETALDENTRESSAVIRSEAQRMKQIIESLVRFWRPSTEEYVPVALDPLLRDIERLRRPEFDRQGIRFTIAAPPLFPRVLGNPNQIRQLLLEILNNASDAIAHAHNGADPPARDHYIRLEIAPEGERLRIAVSDSGRGFPDPNHAFDPLYTSIEPGHTSGLGMSICYGIVREHGGQITAHNLHPRGAAVIMELPIASETHSDSSMLH